MDFDLPIEVSLLEAKSITMRQPVVMQDVKDHLFATTIYPDIRLYVNDNERLTDGDEVFNEVSCAGRVIRFGGGASGGPTITAFIWE